MARTQRSYHSRDACALGNLCNLVACRLVDLMATAARSICACYTPSINAAAMFSASICIALFSVERVAVPVADHHADMFCIMPTRAGQVFEVWLSIIRTLFTVVAQLRGLPWHWRHRPLHRRTTLSNNFTHRAGSVALCCGRSLAQRWTCEHVSMTCGTGVTRMRVRGRSVAAAGPSEARGLNERSAARLSTRFDANLA